ncbi:trehalose-phosphatase [Phytohalomonas tamaricis]|uniref:trehalose-phosphatase n=1 Tax=Phytohalomonas tamaricis TaxID=2081032 RepID=UPI00131A4434|nr:trehalose-phosphatase [Phytohalomonas tamaricis]
MQDNTVFSHCPLPSEPSEWALFLDLDGTLTPLVDHPSNTHVEERMLELLDGLWHALDGALAVVSGRSVKDLERLLAPLRLPLAGQHGAERQDADSKYTNIEPNHEALEQSRQALEQFVEQTPGLFLEDKGASLALHYRNAPDEADAVKQKTHALEQELNGALKIHEGKFVVEIRDTSCNKGRAVQDFMQSAPFKGRCPVFVGDDLTDEDGFEAVNALNGHSIKIGDGPSAASCRLESPAEVLLWLEECLKRVTRS